MNITFPLNSSDPPFGMVMPGRNWQAATAEVYGFGYQGSQYEGDNINTYNTFYRDLDSRLGRWWSIDPYTKITPWESPYISMGNNPLLNNDILGNKWDNSNSESQANDVKAQASTLKANEQAFQSKLQSKINDRIEKGKNTTKLERQLNESKMRMNEFDAAISEIEAMTNSAITYAIDNTFKTTATGVTGEVIYDNTTNAVVIRYDKNNGLPIATLAHELKHGYQFQVGQVDLRRDGTGGGFLTDLTDEVASYRREFAFSPSSLPASINRMSSIDQHFVRSLGYKSAFGPINQNTTLELINHYRVMAGRDRSFKIGNNEAEYLLITTYSEWSQTSNQNMYVNVFNYIPNK